MSLAGIQQVTVDLRQAAHVDKTVRAGLKQLEKDLAREGTTLAIELPQAA
ncbi:MAG: hypothetical protein ACYTFV_15345 [Planctomycetota bacterium]|jgi:hypothetical protein